MSVVFGVSDGVQVSLITTGGIVVVALFGYLGLRSTNRSLRAVKDDVAGVHNTVKDVKKDTHTIDLAVNNAEIGMPTIAQRVIDSDKRAIGQADDLAATREWQASVLKLLAGKLRVDLPPAPAAVAAPEIVLPSGSDEITVPRLTNAEAVEDQEPA